MAVILAPQTENRAAQAQYEWEVETVFGAGGWTRFDEGYAESVQVGVAIGRSSDGGGFDPPKPKIERHGLNMSGG